MPVVRRSERPLGPGRFPLAEKRMLLDEECGARAVSMGEITLHPGAYIPPHRHDVDESFYIVSGQVTCGTDGAECTVAAGDAVLAPTGSLHSLRNDFDQDVTLIYFYPTAAPAGAGGISAEYPRGGHGLTADHIREHQ